MFDKLYLYNKFIPKRNNNNVTGQFHPLATPSSGKELWVSTG